MTDVDYPTKPFGRDRLRESVLRGTQFDPVVVDVFRRVLQP